jgi:hypothetical protein
MMVLLKLIKSKHLEEDLEDGHDLGILPVKALHLLLDELDHQVDEMMSRHYLDVESEEIILLGLLRSLALTEHCENFAHCES